MRRVSLISLVVASLAAAVALAQERYTVSGTGAYPISPSITSMWLAAPDRRPLLMVYFQGPDGWHNTQWKIESKFEKGKPGWVELRSEKTSLRLSLNTESGDAGVQSSNFKISESNTFLVLHTSEPSIAAKVIPLGVFDLPASKDQPASILLLQAHPEIMQRINKEAAGEAHPDK